MNAKDAIDHWLADDGREICHCGVKKGGNFFWLMVLWTRCVRAQGGGGGDLGNTPIIGRSILNLARVMKSNNGDRLHLLSYKH